MKPVPLNREVGMLQLLLIICCAIFTVACQQPKATPAIPVVERDTTITSVNAYSDLFFDSLALERIMQQKSTPDTLAQRLRNFYNGRNYQFAWFTDSGFTEQASIFWNLQSDYISYSGDSSLHNPFLQRLMDSALVYKDSLRLPMRTRMQAEVELTIQFLTYARNAYQGNSTIDEADIGWFIPRKQVNSLALLDSLLTNKEKDLESYGIVNKQYGLLKNHLLRYYALQKKGGWPPISSNVKKFAKGDSLPAIAAIKKRLHTTGDFNSTDTSHLFTDSLQLAVKAFQKSYGLQPDGVIGGNTLRHLNEPVEVRIQQLLVNMERMRWLPEQPKGDFVLVNIPQYNLTAFEEGEPAFTMRIVVGTSQNRTVIFTGNIKYVVFAPFWNVPPGILKNEVLPAIKRDPTYLERNNMEWHNGGVRQKPGPSNALGKVKFLFPNSYNIYLHDSPAKSLFGQQQRAFSHGCIRLAEPKKMAEWLLRKDSVWTTQKIDSAMNAPAEKFVTLKKTVPVIIGYFTAWVDEDGALNFRDDIYGHDKKLADRLFSREVKL